MTYGFGKAQFDSTNVDAFGRLRSSQSETLFEAKYTYGNEERLFKTLVWSGGTATFLPAEAAWSLSTTAATGSRVVRESEMYLPYHPGKSQLIVMTGVFGPAVSGCVKRIGYYDDNDGLYFTQNGTVGFGVGRRSSTSGAAVDQVVYQSDWNLDKMNGTGPSRITLDPASTNIFIIDFQWLGVGLVRFGVNIGGTLHYVHQMSHANVGMTQVYMKSAWLPVRYEVVNLQANAGSLKQICSSVISEGGKESVGNLFTAGNYSGTSINTNTWTPIISIRCGDTMNGQKFRGRLHLYSVDSLTSGSNPAAIAVIEDGILTKSSFTSVAPNSAALSDISATAITGGTYRMTTFNGRTQNNSASPPEYLTLYAGKTYTIAARSIGGNATISVLINWYEVI